jgi:hypothetical protein
LAIFSACISLAAGGEASTEPGVTYPTPPRRAFVHGVPGDEESGAAALATAALMLGRMPRGETPDDARTRAYAAMDWPQRGRVTIGRVEAGAVRLGLRPFSVLAPSASDAALPVDCGCPVLLGSWTPGRGLRHVVVLARHRLEDTDRWLVLDPARVKPDWKTLRKLGRPSTAAIALCSEQVSPQCQRALCDRHFVSDSCVAPVP